MATDEGADPGARRAPGDSSQASGGAHASDEDIRYFAERSTPEFDEVTLQADYAARAAVSFYRFRQLGGGRPDRKGGEGLKFGQSTGNGIHYASDHPDVRLMNLSIIALLILFESAANAYFFAQQSEFGISGGLFQAAAVSLANVSTSYFIIGFWGLRHASMPTGDKAFWSFDRRNVIRSFGLFAIVIGVIMVLLVNLSAAHYRNILDLRAEGLTPPIEHAAMIPRFWISEDVCNSILTSEIGQSIGSAATNAMCRPFALHSLDAMVLFALGLAISALAAFEGRRADSAYPGFSDAARQFERAREDLQYALEDYYDRYESWEAEAGRVLGNGELSGHQKVLLRRALDVRVVPFRRYLTTDADVLRDEFDVPDEAIEQITGASISMPRNSRGDADAEDEA